MLNCGDPVIVETEKGLGFGFVAVNPKLRAEKDIGKPLKKIFRIATDQDFQQKEKNVETETQAFDCCLKYIKQLGLAMNLFSVESTFDASRLTFFFTSEGRVDFRQLVKMLVKEFRVRVEMRQVGIRNQAKMCGGIGRCGRELCCSLFMEKFDPVSIRMAKNRAFPLTRLKFPVNAGGLCAVLHLRMRPIGI